MWLATLVELEQNYISSFRLLTLYFSVFIENFYRLFTPSSHLGPFRWPPSPPASDNKIVSPHKIFSIVVNFIVTQLANRLMDRASEVLMIKSRWKVELFYDWITKIHQNILWWWTCFVQLLYWEDTSDQSVQVIKSSQARLVGFLVDPSSLLSQLSVPDYKSN